MQSLRDDHHPITLPLAVKTVSQLLWFLADCGLQETEYITFTADLYPGISPSYQLWRSVDEIIDANSKNGKPTPR